MKRATISDAPTVLNTNDRAMWVLGFNAAVEAPPEVQPLAAWHDDDGSVMWFTWEDGQWLGEPCYIGSPLCEDWPGYHTHWMLHPNFPAPLPAGVTPCPLCASHDLCKQHGCAGKALERERAALGVPACVIHLTRDPETGEVLRGDPPGVPVVGPRCERCNDTGWHYADPLDPNSLEPCCEKPADGVPEAQAPSNDRATCPAHGGDYHWTQDCPECVKDARARGMSIDAYYSRVRPALRTAGVEGAPGGDVAEALRGLRNLKVLLGADAPEVRGWAPAVQQAAQKAVNTAIHVLKASDGVAAVDKLVPDPGCKTCHGEGRYVAAYSGRDDDGNAPIWEDCDCFIPAGVGGPDHG